MTEIEKLLLDLVKIPSVSGQEKAVGEYIYQKLENIGGFKLEKQFIDKDRFNIIARRGKPKKWLVAHMDTVPGDVPIRITKTKIYGRGSTDNKASVAGAIMAGKKLENIGLLFTVGEERDFCGAKMAKAVIGKDKAIVMEATKFEIYTSQRGVLGVILQAKGIQKHSSLLEDMNDNAFHRIIDVLNNLIHKGWTAFNVGIMNGGVAINVVAGTAEAQIAIRPDNIDEYNQIKKELKELDKTKSVKVKILNDIKPFTTKLAIKGKKKKAFTEMAFFPNSILFGGGDMSVAHTANENINKKDLSQIPEEIIAIFNKI